MVLKHLIKTSKYPIGIDIGAYAVRMLQLEQRGSDVTVAASVVVPLDPSLPAVGPARAAAVTDAIGKAMTGNGFKGNTVVTSLPASHVIYKNIRIPVMPPNEIDRAVAWEASDRLHMSLDDIQLQHLYVGEVRQGDENKQEVILLAVKKHIIDQHVAMLTGCNLAPIAVEAAPSALARWASYHQDSEDQDHAAVVLDLGYDSSKILICRHGRVLFYKQIDAAGRQINEHLAGKLNLGVADIDRNRLELGHGDEDDPQQVGQPTLQRTLSEALRLIATELTREIGLCLRYFSVTFRGQRPERAWVTGGMSRDAMFLGMIQDNSGLKLDTPPMIAGQNLAQSQALACGLAMRLSTHVKQKGQAA